MRISACFRRFFYVYFLNEKVYIQNKNHGCRTYLLRILTTQHSTICNKILEIHFFNKIYYFIHILAYLKYKNK